MNCPLIQPKMEYKEGEELVRMGRCTKEECAWWDEVPKCCLVFSIRAELYLMTEALQGFKGQK